MAKPKADQSEEQPNDEHDYDPRTFATAGTCPHMHGPIQRGESTAIIAARWDLWLLFLLRGHYVVYVVRCQLDQSLANLYAWVNAEAAVGIGYCLVMGPRGKAVALGYKGISQNSLLCGWLVEVAGGSGK